LLQRLEDHPTGYLVARPRRAIDLLNLAEIIDDRRAGPAHDQRHAGPGFGLTCRRNWILPHKVD
jgi:hypothetical protein